MGDTTVLLTSIIIIILFISWIKISFRLKKCSTDRKNNLDKSWMLEKINHYNFEKIKKLDVENNINTISELFYDIICTDLPNSDIVFLNYQGSFILNICFLKLYDIIKETDQHTKDKLYNKIIEKIE
ncbi:MAG: hypothetical protein ACOC2W_00255 [bacterium]